MKNLYLICNAHIDPVWLWTNESGISATLSTFRSAVKLADKYDYIFCHNEALAYEWVEAYDPELFAEIKRLVKSGKWKIVGGWYLQPDCLIPSGDSIILQIEYGRKYFKEKFGVKPEIAYNVDSFGHSGGLPQILVKHGYRGYLCCRPHKEEMPSPDCFVWVGVDGSSIKTVRANEHYNSGYGKAKEKILEKLSSSTTLKNDILLWGVGNHGGGASEVDLSDIKVLQAVTDVIIHSFPEEAFDNISFESEKKGGLLHCMPGCYTSQVTVKQKFRELENALFLAGAMKLAYFLGGGAVNDDDKFKNIEKVIMTTSFHDILPGSAIPEVEDYALNEISGGIAEARKLKEKYFFLLTANEKKAEKGEYPVCVFNPFPTEVKETVTVDVCLEFQNWSDDTQTVFEVKDSDGNSLPCQLVKASSNLNLDWMKRVVFSCVLRPFSINRFSLKERVMQVEKKEAVSCSTDDFAQLGGFKFFKKKTNADPWAMDLNSLTELGEFESDYVLASERETGEFFGSDKPVASQRITEDGEVFTEVEQLLKSGTDYIIARYKLYKSEDCVDVDIDAITLEKDRLIKIRVPFDVVGETRVETMFGEEVFGSGKNEIPVQRYLVRYGETEAVAVLTKSACGVSVDDGYADISLLRTAAYSAHPINDRPLVPTDRYVRRIDEGKRSFSFRILKGSKQKIEKILPAEAMKFNIRPYAVACFPGGQGGLNRREFYVDNPLVTVTFCSVENNTVRVRLFNGHRTDTTANVFIKNTKYALNLSAFEYKEIIFDIENESSIDKKQ